MLAVCVWLVFFWLMSLRPSVAVRVLHVALEVSVVQLGTRAWARFQQCEVCARSRFPVRGAEYVAVWCRDTDVGRRKATCLRTGQASSVWVESRGLEVLAEQGKILGVHLV